MKMKLPAGFQKKKKQNDDNFVEFYVEMSIE